MSEIHINALQQKSIIASAAKKWGVPYGIMVGIYGMESTFGNNVHNSTTGAIGPFQFEPATAATYGYPLTNNPTVAQFTQQADSTGHYLHDLFHRTGSWAGAVVGYGGGYTLADVNAKAQSLQSGTGAFSGGGISPAAAIGGGSAIGLGAIAGEGLAAGDVGATEAAAADSADTAAGGAAGSGAASLATKAATSQLARDVSIASVLTWLSTAKNWVRVLEFVGGAVAIYLALKSLAGVEGSGLPGPVGRLA